MLPLKEHYINSVVPELKKSLNLTSVMAVPKVIKVTLNMGVGEAMNDKKLLERAVEDMTLIAGQKPWREKKMILGKCEQYLVLVSPATVKIISRSFLG